MNKGAIRHRRHLWAELLAGAALLATAISMAGPAASAARADDTPEQQQQKRANDQNTMKDIGIGAGALGLWELLHGRGTNALILGAGAAYAGKKYEDDRKANAAEDRDREQREERRLGEERRRERENAVPPGATALGTSSSAEMPAMQPIRVYVNDQPVAFRDEGPEMTAGSVYVPMRGVLERIGADVRWDADSRSVVATRGDKMVTLPVNGMADVNGQKMSLDTPAYIANGHTMVPLRFLAQTFGAQVAWDPRDRDVHIATPDGVDAGR